MVQNRAQTVSHGDICGILYGVRELLEIVRGWGCRRDEVMESGDAEVQRGSDGYYLQCWNGILILLVLNPEMKAER